MSKVLSFANLVTPTCTVFPSLGAAVDAGRATVQPVVAEIRSKEKAARRDWFKQQSTNWPCISLTEGVNPRLRISHDNPPQLLHGFTADYDNLGKKFTVGELTEIATRCAYPPAAVGSSLGAEGVHAVWLFKEPIPVLGNADYARRVYNECYKNLRAGNFVQGFDEAFKKPDRLLSIDPENFGWATDHNENCVVDETSTRLWASSVTADFSFEGPALDIQKVYELVQQRYPGRWSGEFTIGTRGCRFWDPTATDSTASVVTATGMVFFTNGGGFKSWSSLLGQDVVSKLSAESLAQITADWFYDKTNREYVYSVGGEYATKNRTQLIDRLALSGIEDVMDSRRAICYVEDFKGVTSVVSLANQKLGIIKQGGLTYLNTTKTVAIRPEPGDCSFLLGAVNAMFGSSQVDFYLAWLQDAVRSALREEPSYSQTIFLCGDPECGKSLLQFRIMTPLLGGSWADPMGYLLGDTGFNSELADSGSWIVSDQEGAKNSSQRSSFTQKVKSAAANPCMSVHAKYAVPITLFLNSRLSFSFNRNAECLSVLPRIGDDLLGKICLFSIINHEFFKGKTKALIEGAIKAELPAFADWLLNTYEPPEAVLSSGRYNTKSYHAPELLQYARAAQDSSELLGWLGIIFSQNETLKKDYLDAKKAKEMSSAHWLQVLIATTGHHYSLSPNKLSAHFQNLCKQFPQAISSRLDPKAKIYLFSVDYAKLLEVKHE